MDVQFAWKYMSYSNYIKTTLDLWFRCNLLLFKVIKQCLTIVDFFSHPRRKIFTHLCWHLVSLVTVLVNNERLLKKRNLQTVKEKLTNVLTNKLQGQEALLKTKHVRSMAFNTYILYLRQRQTQYKCSAMYGPELAGNFTVTQIIALTRKTVSYFW